MYGNEFGLNANRNFLRICLTNKLPGNRLFNGVMNDYNAFLLFLDLLEKKLYVPLLISDARK
jgi:hypothetical protein